MTYEQLPTITKEQWLAKRDQLDAATQELVRLWIAADLGTQAELAEQLGVTDRTLRRHVAKLREQGELPPLPETDGRRQGQQKRKAKKDRVSYPLAPVEERPHLRAQPEGRHLTLVKSDTPEPETDRVAELEAELARRERIIEELLAEIDELRQPKPSTRQPEPEPIAGPPTIQWSSELYTAVNNELCAFLDRFEELKTEQLTDGEWHQLGLRGDVIHKITAMHRHNLRKDSES